MARIGTKSATSAESVDGDRHEILASSDLHATPKRLVVSLSDDRAEQHVESDAANTLQPGVDRRGKRRKMRRSSSGRS
jgi:hypothetical protein